MSNPKDLYPRQDVIFECFLAELNRSRDFNFKCIEEPDVVNRVTQDIDYICYDDRTGAQIAVEVTTYVRHCNAGKYDHYWEQFCEKCNLSWNRYQKEKEADQLGRFYIDLPIDFIRRQPTQEYCDNFIKVLIKLIKEQSNQIEKRGEEGRGIHLDIFEHQVLISKYSYNGSEIRFNRIVSDSDVNNFKNHVKTLAIKKGTKLLGYKNKGINTYLVVFNAFYPMTSESMLKEIHTSPPNSLHKSIDFIFEICGNPPNDYWIRQIDLSERLLSEDK